MRIPKHVSPIYVSLGISEISSICGTVYARLQSERAETSASRSASSDGRSRASRGFIVKESASTRTITPSLVRHKIVPSLLVASVLLIASSARRLPLSRFSQRFRNSCQSWLSGLSLPAGLILYIPSQEATIYTGLDWLNHCSLFH